MYLHKLSCALVTSYSLAPLQDIIDVIDHCEVGRADGSELFGLYRLRVGTRLSIALGQKCVSSPVHADSF